MLSPPGFITNKFYLEITVILKCEIDEQEESIEIYI